MQILYTNDLHGKVEAMGKISALAEEARKSNSSTIFLDAGDWARGSFLSDKFKGKPMIEIMNKMGYNAAGIGEGDLSWGIEVLKERAKEANFPLLCANIADEAGQKIENIRSYIALKAGDFKIAVLAVISKEVNYPAASCRVSLRASLFCGMTPRSKTAGYSDRKIKNLKICKFLETFETINLQKLYKRLTDR